MVVVDVLESEPACLVQKYSRGLLPFACEMEIEVFGLLAVSS